ARLRRWPGPGGHPDPGRTGGRPPAPARRRAWPACAGWPCLPRRAPRRPPARRAGRTNRSLPCPSASAPGAEPRDHPEPAARPGRAVAEEAGAGGRGANRDVAAGQPSPGERGGVAPPRVARPPAGAVGPDDAVGAPAEALAHGLRDLLAHLVAVRADRGPD